MMKKNKISMKNTKKDILKEYNALKQKREMTILCLQSIKTENSDLIAHNFSLLDEIEELKKKLPKKENIFTRISRWIKFE